MLISHCCSNNSYGRGFLAGCMKVQTIDAEFLSEFKIEEAFSSFKTDIFLLSVFISRKQCTNICRKLVEKECYREGKEKR